MGKGSRRRNRQVSKEEEELRYDLAYGKIHLVEYMLRLRKLKKKGKITRSGRIIK